MIRIWAYRVPHGRSRHCADEIRVSKVVGKRRRGRVAALTKCQRVRNRRFGKVRAKVKHVFRVLNTQFGYRKVRYRGIAKNGALGFALLALANLSLARVRLAPASGKLDRKHLIRRTDPRIRPPRTGSDVQGFPNSSSP
jgi:hypothetical protein